MTIGKVICVADTKAEMEHWFGTPSRALLNDWGCYCQEKFEGLTIMYMAGTATDPNLIFEVSLMSLLSMVSLRFGGRIDPSIADAAQKLEQSQIETLKESGAETDLEQSEVSVVKFQRGSWEKGLDTSFKASIWLNSNREEALVSIWKIRL